VQPAPLLGDRFMPSSHQRFLNLLGDRLKNLEANPPAPKPDKAEKKKRKTSAGDGDE
jgi:hypothetical protein